MSDPRNVAHAKKVTQEKKHHGADSGPQSTHPAQPGKKSAAATKHRESGGTATTEGTAAPAQVEPVESPAPKPAPALEASLVVLAKLKEMEFHSRGNLERLAELVMTVGDELKQTEIVSPLDEVYSAQNAFQTKLTALIEAYQAECDHLRGEST